VRAGRLGQRERLPDVRANLPGEDVGEELTGVVGAFAGPDLKVPETSHRYLPPPSVGRVDRGEGATGRPVGGEPAAIGHDREGVKAELAADAVEDHNRTSPAGCVKNRGRPARLAVVDRGVRPGLAHGVQLRVAPGGADDPRPPCAQQLNQEDAHPAGRAEDQDLLSRADVDQPGDAKGGRPVVDDRRGEQRIEAVGDRDRFLEADNRPFGVPAAGRADVGDDRPPQPAVVHAVADGDHLPADAAAGDVRRADRKEADAAAGPDHGVDEHHVAHAGGDHEFPRPGHGVGRLDGGEHLRPAEAGDRDRAHRLRPRSAGSRPRRRRGSAVRAARDRRCRR
jgi:hypothetical protein